jgi:hypothetical protein
VPEVAAMSADEVGRMSTANVRPMSAGVVACNAATTVATTEVATTEVATTEVTAAVTAAAVTATPVTAAPVGGECARRKRQAADREKCC